MKRDGFIRDIFILAGSNLGDRKANLEFALRSLAQTETVLKLSSFFETEPVGNRNQPWFLNQAIELESDRTPSDLLFFCQSIEKSRGRIRTFPNAPRTLDLDILLCGDMVVNQPDLIIPHPRLSERRFVLEPLAEIAPNLMHPVLGKSIRSLLEICADRSSVRLWSGGLQGE